MDLGRAYAILDTAHDAFVSMDAEGEITAWNARAEQIFGLARDDAIGRPLAETIVPARHRDAHRDGLERFLRTGEGPVLGRRVELTALRRDGVELPIELTISALADGDGWSFHAFVRDISERKEAERRLGAAELLFRTSFENAPIGMALVGLDGRFIEVNHALCAIVGHGRETLQAMTFQDITHPDDVDADLALLQRLIAGEIPSCAMEKRYLHAAGGEVPIALYVSLVCDEEGAPVHAIAQIRDITEAKAAEVGLGRYRALVESAEDAIYAVDREDRLLTWNQGAERLFGYAAEEAIGREREMLVPPDRLSEIAVIRADVFAGRSVRRETLRRRRDGSLVEVQISMSPVRDQAGHVIGACTVARDVSDRVAADRARTALQRDLARAHDRYAGVLAAATESAIIGTDAEGTITVFNTGAERMLGYRADDVVGRAPLSLMHDPGELRERARALGVRPGFEVFATAVRRELSDSGEWTYVRKDGDHRRVSLTVTGQRDEAGDLTGFLAIATDVTEAKRAEALFRGAFEDAPIGVALLLAAGPSAGVLVRANAALEELLGLDGGALVGRTLASLVHPDDRAASLAALDRLRAGAGRVRSEQRLRHADGHEVWALVSSSLVRAGEDMAPQVITQVMDISERKRFEGRMQHLADHDALTGLHNRRRFEQELTRVLAHVDRYAGRGAVLLLDLDRFKQVNDTLGHLAGDEMLMRVGGILRGSLRATDDLARLGGDEFAVVLPEATEEEAVAVASKLVAAVGRDGVVRTAEREARVTTSIGIAAFEGGSGLLAEDVLADADVAMYETKSAGGDGATVSGGEHRREHATPRAQWVERLRAGLEEGRFRLLAQPIRPLAAAAPPWHELLLRFEDDDGDLVPPATFLYVAERFDLVQDIDRWVLGEAVRLLHAEHEAGRDLRLAVNVSARSLADVGLGDHVAGLLAERPLRSGRLVVEVSETTAITNVDGTGVLADRLHELGCGFAVDGFGAGFASFGYLKHLNVDYLKIDGELVRTLAESATDRLVIEAIVHVARGTGAETVAALVGDEATLELVRGLGVDHAQGHHLGRPVQVAEALPGWREPTP